MQFLSWNVRENTWLTTSTNAREPWSSILVPFYSKISKTKDDLEDRSVSSHQFDAIESAHGCSPSAKKWFFCKIFATVFVVEIKIKKPLRSTQERRNDKEKAMMTKQSRDSLCTVTLKIVHSIWDRSITVYTYLLLSNIREVFRHSQFTHTYLSHVIDTKFSVSCIILRGGSFVCIRNLHHSNLVCRKCEGVI